MHSRVTRTRASRSPTPPTSDRGRDGQTTPARPPSIFHRHLLLPAPPRISRAILARGSGGATPGQRRDSFILPSRTCLHPGDWVTFAPRKDEGFCKADIYYAGAAKRSVQPRRSRHAGFVEFCCRRNAPRKILNAGIKDMMEVRRIFRLHKSPLRHDVWHRQDRGLTPFP